MLSEALQNGAVKPSGLYINKAVTFIFSGSRKRQIFNKTVKAIRQNARTDLSLTLKELFGVAKVIVRSVQDDKLIRSRADLWTSIASSEHPIFWMFHESEGRTTSAPATAKQTDKRDYSSHAILGLENMVDKLDSQDHARSAQSRLNLIRENHRHSAEFVKEVKEYFAPLEQDTAAQWRELSTRKQMCEDAMKDIAHFYKLRPLIADLEDAQQAHAQQYFALINANNSLASVAAEHLIKLLSPDSTQLDDLSKLANTFEEVRRDTIRGGAATPHV